VDIAHHSEFLQCHTDVCVGDVLSTKRLSEIQPTLSEKLRSHLATEKQQSLLYFLVHHFNLRPTLSALCGHILISFWSTTVSITGWQHWCIKYGRQHTYFRQSVTMLQPEICDHPHNTCSTCPPPRCRKLSELSAMLLHLFGKVYLLTFSNLSHSVVYERHYVRAFLASFHKLISWQLPLPRFDRQMCTLWLSVIGNKYI